MNDNERQAHSVAFFNLHWTKLLGISGIAGAHLVPSEEPALGLAPCVSNTSAASNWFSMIASCSAVQPAWSWTLTSTPVSKQSVHAAWEEGEKGRRGEGEKERERERERESTLSFSNFHSGSFQCQSLHLSTFRHFLLVITKQHCRSVIILRCRKKAALTMVLCN